MAEKQNFPGVSECSGDVLNYINSSSQFIANESLEDADTEPDSSKLFEDIIHRMEAMPSLWQRFPLVTHPQNVQTSNSELTINNDVLTKSGDDHNSGIHLHSPIVSAQDSHSKTTKPKPLGNIALMIENSHSLQGQFSSMVHERDRKTSNILVCIGDAFLDKEHSDPLDLKIKHPFPRNVSNLASSFGILSLNEIEDMHSLDETPYFLQNQDPFMTSARHSTPINTHENSNKENKLQSRPVIDSTFSQFPSIRQHTGEQFKKEYSPIMPMGNNHKPMGFHSIGHNVILQKEDRNLSKWRDDTLSESDLSSIGNDEDEYITNERIMDIAYQLSGMVNSKVRNEDNALQKRKNVPYGPKEKFFENYGSSNEIRQKQYISNSSVLDNNTQYFRFSNENTFAPPMNNFFNRRENVVVESASSSINSQDHYQNIEILGRNSELVRNPDFAIKYQNYPSNEDQHIPITIPYQNYLSDEDQHMPITIPYQNYLSDEDQYVPITTPYHNDIQYLEESKGYNTQVQKIALPNLLTDIAQNYWMLYDQTPPENYDFAMNIMAYVEILNNSSWRETNSYLNNVVKFMIKKIWNENKDFFNSKTELRTARCEILDELMTIFTKRILSSDYDLGQFLNYCVLLCQLGVLARKRGFNESPLRVIQILREAIVIFEHSQQVVFELRVQEHAQEQIWYILKGVNCRG